MYSKVLWDHPISFSTYWFLLKSVKDYNCPVDGFAKFALSIFFARIFGQSCRSQQNILHSPPVNTPLAGNLKLELENEMAAHYWKLDLVENRGQLLLFSACVITPASLNFLKKTPVLRLAWTKGLEAIEILDLFRNHKPLPCLAFCSWISSIHLPL